MHSSGLGPPAGSGPAQRGSHPLHLLPRAMVSCSPSIPPWEGKGPTHRLSSQSCLSRLSSGYGFNTPFLRAYQLRVPTLAERPVSPCEEEGGSAEGHSSSLKRGGICWKNRTVKHRGGKAEIPYMESGGCMAYIGTLQDPCPDTSTPAGLCSLDFQ